MLERYRDAVASIRGDLRGQVLDYFALSRLSRRSLYDILDGAGVGQADLVLSLLRIRHPGAEPAVERLVGRPIQRLPPQRRGFVKPLVRGRVGDDRLVTHFVIGGTTLKGGAILEGSPMYDRLSVVKPGMSLLALLARGVTRRDVRIATRRGWLVLEKEKAA